MHVSWDPSQKLKLEGQFDSPDEMFAKWGGSPGYLQVEHTFNND